MSEFDLFGDPIPAGRGKRGRPEHVATTENRNKVMVLLALGWSTDRVASAIKVDAKTLRKHYSRELRDRDQARDRLEGVRLLALFDGARKGSVPANRELGRIVEKAEAGRIAAAYHERDEIARADSAKRAAAAKLGKKEAAAIAATTAGVGSDWGDDLLPPERPN